MRGCHEHAAIAERRQSGSLLAVTMGWHDGMCCCTPHSTLACRSACGFSVLISSHVPLRYRQRSRHVSSIVFSRRSQSAPTVTTQPSSLFIHIVCVACRSGKRAVSVMDTIRSPDSGTMELSERTGNDRQNRLAETVRQSSTRQSPLRVMTSHGRCILHER